MLAPPVDSYGSLPVHKAAEREVGERGALSDFPISPSRVHRAASTARPTADEDDDDDDMRRACLNPAYVSQS